MVYDCFTFFNELELLRLRFHELAGVVDKFVLVEATRTFTNIPKPLYFWENRSRFSEFGEKILHVVVEDSPDTPNAWAVEYFQRNCIARALSNCLPDDWILISDVDEIPRAETVSRVTREHKFPHGFVADYIARPIVRGLSAWSFSRGRVRRNNPFILKFQQSNHRYFLNCVTVNPPELANWYGTRMLFYRDLISPELARHSGYRIIKDGGWHFSFMGGAARIQEKLKSFAHQELNKETFLEAAAGIDTSIESGRCILDPGQEFEFVQIGNSFPRYIREHPEQFGNWIKPV